MRTSRLERYFGDPESTAEAIDAEGWFHTGDLCSLDEDGRVSYHGRLKDMLKVGAALSVVTYIILLLLVPLYWPLIGIGR